MENKSRLSRDKWLLFCNTRHFFKEKQVFLWFFARFALSLQEIYAYGQ